MGGITCSKACTELNPARSKQNTAACLCVLNVIVIEFAAHLLRSICMK